MDEAERGVCLVLAGHGSAIMEAYPSVGTIADELKVDTRTVQRAVARLEAKGILRVEGRGGRNGKRGITNTYRFCIPHSDLPRQPECHPCPIELPRQTEPSTVTNPYAYGDTQAVTQTSEQIEHHPPQPPAGGSGGGGKPESEEAQRREDTKAALGRLGVSEKKAAQLAALGISSELVAMAWAEVEQTRPAPKSPQGLLVSQLEDPVHRRALQRRRDETVRKQAQAMQAAAEYAERERAEQEKQRMAKAKVAAYREAWPSLPDSERAAILASVADNLGPRPWPEFRQALRADPWAYWTLREMLVTEMTNRGLAPTGWKTD